MDQHQIIKKAKGKKKSANKTTKNKQTGERLVKTEKLPSVQEPVMVKEVANNEGSVKVGCTCQIEKVEEIEEQPIAEEPVKNEKVPPRVEPEITDMGEPVEFEEESNCKVPIEIECFCQMEVIVKIEDVNTKGKCEKTEETATKKEQVIIAKLPSEQESVRMKGAKIEVEPDITDELPTMEEPVETEKLPTEMKLRMIHDFNNLEEPVMTDQMPSMLKPNKCVPWVPLSLLSLAATSLANSGGLMDKENLPLRTKSTLHCSDIQAENCGAQSAVTAEQSALMRTQTD
nr:expressed protein [Hymenolepis microstoma]